MQLTTLAKKSYKGFTLIELLVVIAIIGLLSTIVAAPVQSARKKAKDTKKIAEIKQVQTALANYANDNGQFPQGFSSPTLTALTPSYIPSLPTSLTALATNARDKTYYTSYNAIPVGASTTQRKTFGYHLGATLEVYNAVLADDNDCWGVVSTSTSGNTGLKNGGPCVAYVSGSTTSNSPSYAGSGLATNISPITGYTATAISGITGIATTTNGATFVFESSNWVSHPQALNPWSDFQGLGVAESSTSTCTTIDQCVFDVADSY